VNKLSVGETVRFAYAFTLRELGTIIGLIWVPMVALAVINFLPYAIGDASPPPDLNPNAASAIVLRGFAFSLVGILLSACVTVPVIRQAMGLRTGPAFIHFAVGAAELRLWGGYLLLFGILFVLMMGLVLAVVVAAVATSFTGNKIVEGMTVTLVLLAGLCGLLYALVRLSFLLPVVVVAENRVSFERGWLLTAGNFWRIAAVLFVVTLPPALLFLGAFGWLIGPDMVALFRQAQHLDPQVIADRMNLIMNSHISTMLGIQLIIAPFSVGLTASAAAHAYKTLAGNARAATPQP